MIMYSTFFVHYIYFISHNIEFLDFLLYNYSKHMFVFLGGYNG